MAPADLGTGSGNGAAVPALPMHTDPVSIAVRSLSTATECMPMCWMLGLLCGCLCSWSANHQTRSPGKFLRMMWPATPGGGEADGAAEQGRRHGAHGGAGQHVAAGAHAAPPAGLVLLRIQ
jgi:hypothetical protein